MRSRSRARVGEGLVVGAGTGAVVGTVAKVGAEVRAGVGTGTVVGAGAGAWAGERGGALLLATLGQE